MDSPGPYQRLLEISRSMNRTQDREQLLSYLSDGLRELFDAENSFVILFEEDGRTRILAAHMKDESAEHSPLSATILERVRTSRELVVIDDASEQPELLKHESIARFKISSVLCTPLRVGDKVIGALQFDHRGAPQPFSGQDRRLLSLYADHAATAIHNILLFELYKEALAETRAAQVRMVQSERLSALGEMAAGIAHDFNNTLFVALGFCDVLLSREGLEREVQVSIEKIRTCALDAANTVRRLQSFARGRSTDDRAINLEPDQLMDDMPAFTRHKWNVEARRRGIKIQVEKVLEKTPPVHAVAAEIREILTNFIFNAVDAIRENGTIELSTRVDGDRVVFQVKDDGVGMDDETRRRLFEPFFTTKGARGYGFGLSTCWKLAQGLGGEIEFDSEEGAGSTFRLVLPAAAEEPTILVEAGPKASQSGSILVVDDEVDVLDMLKNVLGQIGHHVVAYSDPKLALAAFERGRFDAIVTDLGMPDMNGVEFAREIRRIGSTIPIIVLTGWGSDVGQDEDISSHVNAVLSKPVSLEVLRNELARVLVASGIEDNGKRMNMR